MTSKLCLAILVGLSLPAAAQPGGSPLEQYYELGARQQSSNRLQEALGTYQQALAACSRIYGGSDEHNLVPLEKIYDVHVLLQNWTGAEQDRRQALAIELYSRSSDAPEVARERIRLATLLFERSRYPEAEMLYRDAIAALERSPITNHDEAPARMVDLANLLRLDNKAAEAAQWDARARQIRTNRYQ